MLTKTSTDDIHSTLCPFRFDAAPGGEQPGARSGLDTLSSLGSIPPMSSTANKSSTNGSGGGDLLDLL